MADVCSVKYDESCRALIGLLMCPEGSLATDWLAGYSATEHALSTIGYVQQSSVSELVGRVSSPRCDVM